MKALKFIAIAAAPIILIVGLWMFISSGKNELPTDYLYADVVTGEVVSLDRASIKTIPAANKRDGKRTLYPVDRDAQGNYVIKERFRVGLADTAKTVGGPLKVDQQTFIVKQ